MVILTVVSVTVAVFVGITVLASLFNGWALSVLWGWFLVPLGLPQIGMAHAIGIGLLVGFLTKTHLHAEKEFDSKWEKAAAHTAVILNPLLVVGMGWVIAQFM